MPPSDRLVELWPAAGLHIRAGNLELRWIDDGLLVELADLASHGVHDPQRLPFNVPWTRGTELEVARNVMTYQWVSRQHVGPGRLVLQFGVLLDGIPVGIQAASGDNWAELREVETGSWLGQEFHGRGIGTRMRAMMLHACFEGLAARDVTSSAYDDNPASNAISRRTGYEPDGLDCVVRDGASATLIRYRMTRDRWAEARSINADLIGAPVELVGFEAFRQQLDQESRE